MTVKAYFEDIEYEIINLLRSSRESVKICVAWINGKIYTPILEDLAHKGISVELIYDNNTTNLNHGVVASASYRTYPINTRLSSAIMHNKFCIIDNSTLITGSYNWSNKAKDSFENIVVVKDEFHLIKSFLHEFYDLINYYKAFDSNYVSKCSCGSNLFNLGILGQESGLYDESKVDIWSVCVKHNHVISLGEEYEQHLQTYLGIKDAPDRDEYDYSKDSMWSEFQQENSQELALQDYFNKRTGNKIHAVGCVIINNFNEHNKWGEDPEYVVSIFLKDMYLRKIIPNTLYGDFEGINRIILEHV